MLSNNIYLDNLDDNPDDFIDLGEYESDVSYSEILEYLETIHILWRNQLGNANREETVEK